MFKYIKWELKDLLSKNILTLAIVAGVYLLSWIAVKNDMTDSFEVVIVLFSIILVMSVFCAFYAGTKRTLETFESQTFLLESMIPISPEQLLLAKYIIAIVLNFFYVCIFILGMAIVFSADSKLLDYILKLAFENVDELARVLVDLSVYTTFFTAIVTFVFVAFKSLFPNGKFAKVISFVVGYFGVSYIATMATELFQDSRTGLYVIELGSVVAAFFLTTTLIKNKLEIYK